MKPECNFTAAQSEFAFTEWGFNCGPASIAAILGMTTDEIRPHLLDFESKGYVGPTAMNNILRDLGCGFKRVYRGDVPGVTHAELQRGLIRTQFDGPWCKPGAPMAARYGHTHWSAMQIDRETGQSWIFDVNAMEDCGGWLPYEIWRDELIPWLIQATTPKASGDWWITHAIEVYK